MTVSAPNHERVVIGIVDGEPADRGADRYVGCARTGVLLRGREPVRGVPPHSKLYQVS